MFTGIIAKIRNLYADYESVKQMCEDGRYFARNCWQDSMFVTLGFPLVWIFVRLGLSGNQVSWLSGVVAIIGGCLISTKNNTLIPIGAFTYIIYYLLDYVDGGVARCGKEAGISGQYIDLIAHILSAVAIVSGIVIGAINQLGFWMVPFGVLFILAAVLQLDRFSFGWWSLCMQRQQNVCKEQLSVVDEQVTVNDSSKFCRLVWKVVSGASVVLFHETYLIFTLPFVAIMQSVFNPMPGFIPDFRVVLTLLGGTVYFTYTVHSIMIFANQKRLEKTYNRMFCSGVKPNLPAEHFFDL